MSGWLRGEVLVAQRLVLLVEIRALDLKLHSSLFLLLLVLCNLSLHIDLTPLLRDSVLIIVDIDVHYILLMELLSPSVRDTVLDLVFQNNFIWRLSQSLADACLVELIELVIELCDHLLDVLGLFLLIKLVNHSLFDFTLTDRDASLLVVSQSVGDGLLSEDLFYWRVFVLLQQVDISIIPIVYQVLVQLECVLGLTERLFAGIIHYVDVIYLLRSIL